MANRIQLRRGLKSKMGTLAVGEPAFTTDTREFFLGSSGGNINMSGSQWYSGINLSGDNSSSTYAYATCPAVKVGDLYLNTTSGTVYQCAIAGSGSAAKWKYKATLKGAKGDTGPKGADGEDGYLTDAQRLEIGYYIMAAASAEIEGKTCRTDVNAEKYIIKPDESTQIIKLYCYCPEGLPDGCFMGIFIANNADNTYVTGGTEFEGTQYYADFISGKYYKRIFYKSNSLSFHDWQVVDSIPYL